MRRTIRAFWIGFKAQIRLMPCGTSVVGMPVYVTPRGFS